MAVGKLNSRTSLRDVAIGRVAVARRQLAEVVGQAADPCMAPGRAFRIPAVVFTEIRYVGQPIKGTTVDDRG